jgi:hypothetical protein
MQHQQPGRVKCYMNVMVLTQCKNSCYMYQNEVLFYYNIGGYGTKANATVLDLASEKEGRDKKHNVNLVPHGWTTPHLWGVTSPCTAEGQLNATGSILAVTPGLAANKMQNQGFTRTECHKIAKEAKEPKTKVETFTSLD